MIWINSLWDFHWAKKISLACCECALFPIYPSLKFFFCVNFTCAIITINLSHYIRKHAETEKLESKYLIKGDKSRDYLTTYIRTDDKQLSKRFFRFRKKKKSCSCEGASRIFGQVQSKKCFRLEINANISDDDLNQM